MIQNILAWKLLLRYSTSSITSCLTISSEISELILLELGEPGTWSGLAVCSVAGVFARWCWNASKTVGMNCSQSSNSRPCVWEKDLFNVFLSGVLICFSVFHHIWVVQEHSGPFLLFMNYPLGKPRLHVWERQAQSWVFGRKVWDWRRYFHWCITSG